MSSKLTLRQPMPIDEETYWKKLFFNADYNKKLFLEGLKFKQYEMLELTEHPDGSWTRKMRGEPSSEAPAIVQKIVGTTAYTEEGRYDPKDKIYRYTQTPVKLADKVKMVGTIRLETKGEKQIERIVEVEFSAKILGVGGAIESFIEKTNRDAWEKNAAYSRQYVAEQKL
jgi:hypothetical protein